jgi:hypothetical protein
VLGFLHICLQPYFCHLINESLSHAPNDKFSAAHNAKLIRYQAQYTIVKRLCLIGGFLLFLRFPMSFVPGWNTPAQVCLRRVAPVFHWVQWPRRSHLLQAAASTEWLRGPHVCTFRTKSMYHLGWSLPMADPSYNIMVRFALVEKSQP